MYNYFLVGCVRGNGWENTQHILTNYYNGHENTYTGTIWEWMKGLESSNTILANHLFIPNVEELRKVALNTSDRNVTVDTEEGSDYFQYSKNIGVLLGLTYDSFWSSSQRCDGHFGSFFVYFLDGVVGYSDKFMAKRCLALLHFDALA